MTTSLAGKVVLITGASSGFGSDTARLFAAEGCSVVLAARRIDRLQALAEELQAAGRSALAVPVDVANRDEIASMMAAVFDIYGQVDILFNNAGFGRLDWFELLEVDRDIHTQVEVNLVGVMDVTRAILPHMIQRRSGHIINMASVAGWIAAPTYTVYAATKYGVRGFTDALRREVSPFGIKVSGIYPGPAATEFGQHTGESSAKRRLGRRMPGWITMSSQQVARRVVQLAKQPRRAVIMPWWFRPAIWANDNLPWLVDAILDHFVTRRMHQAPELPAQDRPTIR